MAQKETKQPARASLTISEACQVLGVSEAALRQWTDEGKVKAFVTPGGHRRYAEPDLRALMRQQHRMHGLREMGDRVEGVVPKEREVAQQYMRSSDWYGKLDDDAKQRLKERGNRLVNALAQFVTRPSLRVRRPKSVVELEGNTGRTWLEPDCRSLMRSRRSYGTATLSSRQSWG